MRSVIIPAAGLATRMKPLSHGVSKAMIPVNGRPLISYVIEKICQDKNVHEIIIVENEIGDISEFVSRVYSDINVKCVKQGEKLGPLHAISIGATALDHPTDNGVTVWLGDTICFDEFNYCNSFLAVHTVQDPHRWCLVDSNGNLYDKPETTVPTKSALIGIYNFTNRKAFIEALAVGMENPNAKGQYEIASLLEPYMKANGAMDLASTTEWYDCGELNTYYETKARLLSRTARSFNSIKVDTFYGTVTKSSTDAEKQIKIEAEKNWFNSLSEEQSLFCPRILKSAKGTLKMSLEPGTALNEVLVYDNLRTDIWHEIIRKILNIHHNVFYTLTDETVSYEEAAKHCFEHYYIKTCNRLKDISKYVDLAQPEIEFLLDTGLQLCRGVLWSNVMHGDSHLGNIIYDPHSGAIKFVDPRGVFGKTWTQGDLRYDMAKLLQDFYCGYAMILAERYKWINENEIEIDWVPGTENLSEFLETELQIGFYNVHMLKKLSVLLLITAIPFHTDNPERQKAMFARGRQLIKSLTINNQAN